ncbi:MAG TPA: DegT/DnrJ/EryC1/StrS family aminotransferase [Acidimicrobiia bacterium]|nr:DegT/DnrJ/EryC1/StrS family aminotransferase [Acidimicrobiia bacterium]
MTTPIRLSDPAFGPEVEDLVIQVLRAGQVAQGPMVARLEHLAAEMAGTSDAVALVNGTAALETALELVGMAVGDEVITSPLTFPATLNAILRAGATARFADVAPDFTLEPGSVASLVGPRTKVILPVHLFGLPADMESLDALARRHGLALVEDACQAHGAECGGRRAGGFGLGCFSLYATKNVAGAEGGLLTTSDEEQARRARLIRNQGFEDGDRSPRLVGRNLRLTDLQAAVAVPHLEALPDTNAARRANAERLSRHVTGIAGVEAPLVSPDRRSVWHQYTVLLPAGVDRARVRAQMSQCGVETQVHYSRLVWDHPAYRDHPAVRPDPTPAAAAILDCWLSLPIHPGLRSGDLARIAEALAAALAGAP